MAPSPSGHDVRIAFLKYLLRYYYSHDIGPDCMPLTPPGMQTPGCPSRIDNLTDTRGIKRKNGQSASPRGHQLGFSLTHSHSSSSVRYCRDEAASRARSASGMWSSTASAQLFHRGSPGSLSSMPRSVRRGLKVDNAAVKRMSATRLPCFVLRALVVTFTGGEGGGTAGKP